MKRTQLQNCWFALAAISLAVLASPIAASAQETLTGQTMGTIQYSVKIDRLPAGLDRQRAQAIVDRELDLVNTRMSTYRADSEVSLFNSHSSTEWFPVSAEVCAVVARALEISRFSEGAFDITVAPLVNLWNFGPNPQDRTKLPSAEEIAAAKARIGYQKLHVRLDPPALKKDDPELWIDLSAIAEGYAVDRVAQALVEAGVAACLVDVGGEIVARGTKSDGEVWRVGVVFPSDDVAMSTYREIAKLDNVALATSGDYRNFTIVDGKRYSHEINPATGWPADNGLASATVIAPDCMTADAMATAVMVMGLNRGRQLCASMQLPLLTYQREGESITMWRSPDFPFANATPVAVPAQEQAGGWTVFIASAMIFGLVVAAMAIGVIFGNRRIAGSCGGLGNLRDEHGNISCALCTNPRQECRDAKRWESGEHAHEESVDDGREEE